MRYLLTLSLVLAVLMLNLVPTGSQPLAFCDEDEEWEEFYDGPPNYNWYEGMELEDVAEMSRTQ